MRIEQIRLKNFKMFQDVTVKDIQPFTVLVGANGSGKSTFFDVFGFLRDCLKDNVRSALTRRGGFREVVTRGHEGQPILIELNLGMPLRIEGTDRERTVHTSSRLLRAMAKSASHTNNSVIQDLAVANLPIHRFQRRRRVSNQQ